MLRPLPPPGWSPPEPSARERPCAALQVGGPASHTRSSKHIRGVRISNGRLRCLLFTPPRGSRNSCSGVLSSRAVLTAAPLTAPLQAQPTIPSRAAQRPCALSVPKHRKRRFGSAAAVSEGPWEGPWNAKDRSCASSFIHCQTSPLGPEGQGTLHGTSALSRLSPSHLPRAKPKLEQETDRPGSRSSVVRQKKGAASSRRSKAGTFGVRSSRVAGVLRVAEASLQDQRQYTARSGEQDCTRTVREEEVPRWDQSQYPHALQSS